jgi:hypothetical protein
MLFIYPPSQASIPGVATEATLLLVEQNTADTVQELQGVNSELNTQTTELQSLVAKDFATETTLAAAAADIALLEAKDFATETTLSALNTKVATVDTGNVTISSSALPTGAATEAKQDSIITELQSIASVGSPTVVDQIDSTPLLDVSSSNIPASASLPLQVVASTAALVSKIVSVEDIGEFIGVYTGPASSEVLLCVLPLGGGEMQVQIPASTRISLRHMKNSAITSGFISLNLLG